MLPSSSGFWKKWFWLRANTGNRKLQKLLICLNCMKQCKCFPALLQKDLARRSLGNLPWPLAWAAFWNVLYHPSRLRKIRLPLLFDSPNWVGWKWLKVAESARASDCGACLSLLKDCLISENKSSRWHLRTVFQYKWQVPWHAYWTRCSYCPIWRCHCWGGPYLGSKEIESGYTSSESVGFVLVHL